MQSKTTRSQRGALGLDPSLQPGLGNPGKLAASAASAASPQGALARPIGPTATQPRGDVSRPFREGQQGNPSAFPCDYLGERIRGSLKAARTCSIRIELCRVFEGVLTFPTWMSAGSNRVQTARSFDIQRAQRYSKTRTRVVKRQVPQSAKETDAETLKACCRDHRSDLPARECCHSKHFFPIAPKRSASDNWLLLTPLQKV